MCVGVTLGSDDLINIPACKANLFHSEGCSCNGATHEGDIGEWAGGTKTHPSMRRTQTHWNRAYKSTNCEWCMLVSTVKICVGFHREITATAWKLWCKPPRCGWEHRTTALADFLFWGQPFSILHIFYGYILRDSFRLRKYFTIIHNCFAYFWKAPSQKAPSRCGLLEAK